MFCISTAARVFATAGSDDKTAACVALGAAQAVNYRTTDWVKVCRDAMKQHQEEVGST